MPALNIADCINETCPWSGKPVQPDSLTEFDGQVVGFCNTGCRDKFELAIRHFESARGGGRQPGILTIMPSGEEPRAFPFQFSSASPGSGLPGNREARMAGQGRGNRSRRPARGKRQQAAGFKCVGRRRARWRG